MPSQTKAILRQTPSSQGQPDFPLKSQQSTRIGREATCDIVLDSSQAKGVSRQHMEIRSLKTSTGTQWQICDLGSSNGTYVNQQRVQGDLVLQSGDRIRLGKQGPEFIFEVQNSSRGNRPVAQPLAINSHNSLHLSQVVPIFGTRQRLLSKAYLVPGILTVLFVVALFSSIGKPWLFNAILSIYLSAAAYFAVYQMSGKPKPWWAIVSMVFFTMLILVSPIFPLFSLVFRGILPGDIPKDSNALQNLGFVPLFIKMFFGAGLMEELLKALPVFAMLGLGQSLRSPWREKVGVWEPLDGILLGAASGIGFTLLETLGQYIPNIVHTVTEQAGNGAGELIGIHLLIPRIISSVFGHIAYSGYFGYFIGLSLLIPSRRWRVLGIGYLTASLLHALWNSAAIVSPIALAIAGVMSYAFLMAAILKARQLSPTRTQNFATRYIP